MRADVYLAAEGYARGRGEAKKLILDGLAVCDGRVIAKPAQEIDDSLPHTVSITETGEECFASRGGKKLAHALDVFGVSPEGRIALDIGASSGGFTDCLLRRGAAHVYALDCGSGQLVESLRGDARVTVMENYNARYLDACDFPCLPSLLTMDVSFISQTLIFPAIASLLREGGELVSLVKPQFEVGREGIGKGGIVRDAALRRTALDRVAASAASLGWSLLATTESPIPGGDGNMEYLAHFSIGASHREKEDDPI